MSDKVYGKFDELTASKGIYLGNTANAAANVLDWYEEGTFTPTVIGSTSAGVGTYTAQVGKYTRIGRVVAYDINLTWTAHTGTGNLRFAGLPFTQAAGVEASASIGYCNNIVLTANNIMTCTVAAGSAILVPYQTPVGGGTGASVPIDVAGTIYISGSYTV